MHHAAKILMIVTCLVCIQGLEINANHWPCLDHVITVLYALNNYEGNNKKRNFLVIDWIQYIIMTSCNIAVYTVLFSFNLCYVSFQNTLSALGTSLICSLLKYYKLCKMKHRLSYYKVYEYITFCIF